jgi:deoxyribodipyrimidine photo-lyase
MTNYLRVRKLSVPEYSGGIVVYQMCRDIRAQDNDALLYAIELAESKNEKVIVNYVIYNYLWDGGTRRFYDWVITSLQEVETTLRAHNIPLMITFQDKNIFSSDKLTLISDNVGAVVIDQLPLTFMKKWKSNFLAHNKAIPLYEVDAHNCIPVWELSPKQEFAARTIRPKVYAKISQFLEEYPPLPKYKHNNEAMELYPSINWDDINSKIICNEEVKAISWLTPGAKSAHEVATDFLTKKLESYDEARNNFNVDGQSNLSAYISHGNISRRRIVQMALAHTKLPIQSIIDEKQNGSNGKLGSVSAFIEELVVRAELCDNYCFYNDDYAKVSGFADWAKKELDNARSDKREYVYSQKQFELAQTHDEVWNAAQNQLLKHGKMHGYMRMYWAKKILEWTATPEDAMKIAIHLNDTYEIDGREPGGYVGCAWSIGGVHDRPWFSRPIFGSIRYMAISGIEKRSDPKLYINKWNL